MKMKSIKIALAITLGISFSACSDFFNPNAENALLEKNYVGNYSELYSGYMGLAGTVSDVADQLIYIEGLRGDFLEPTANGTREMWDVYNYAENIKGNSIADPKGLYRVIMNCNDYLKHLNDFRAKNPTVLDATVYNGLTGGALRYKAWAYLQLAKIYGEAIYFDEPLTEYQDLSKYPLFTFDQLIDKCIDLIEVGVNGVNGKGDVVWSTALFPGQAQSPTSLSWDRITPPAETILAEAYLYKQDYSSCLRNCLSLLTRGGMVEDSYQLNLSEYNGEWKTYFGNTSDIVRFEQIAVAYYSYVNGQTNHLMTYFSNQYPNKYLLRPSQAGMNRFLGQYTSAGLPGDKYRGLGVTFAQTNGDYVLQKYLRVNSTTDNIYRSDVQVTLYRAATIHLFMIESLVGLGRFEEAYNFLNDGVGGYYNAKTGVWNAPFNNTNPMPYPSSLYQTPNKASNKANRGVRGRVDLKPVGEFAWKLNSSVLATALDTLKAIQRMDSLLVEETSLELAGEGAAYYAMKRMARKWAAVSNKTWANDFINKAHAQGATPETLWGDNTRLVWASKVGAKYLNGNGSIVKSKLESDLRNWDIIYPLK